MQKTAINNLVLTDLSSSRWLAELPKHINLAGFYQQLAALGVIQRAGAKEVFSELGNKLIVLADQAYKLRQVDTVEQVSRVFLNSPLASQFENVGHYYKALVILQKKRFAEARAILEQIADKIPPQFRAKAMISIAATFYASGNFQSSLPFCVEAGRAAVHHESYDLQSFVISQRNIAIHKSADGDHSGALADLEKLFPLVRAVGRWQPYLFYEHLNSLAVEMMESGRFEEARNASQIALASPFASAYPEWHETREEINLKGYRASRSVASLTQRTSKTDNLLRLPARSGCSVVAALRPARKDTSARILNYSEWKKKMGKDPDDSQTDDDEEMTERDIFLQVIDLTSQQDLTEKKLRRILEAVKKIISEPDEI